MAMKMKTKKALAGLAADGVSMRVRSLAAYMASNCVVVTPHVGRARCFIPMTDSAYGLDLSQFTEEGGTFYKTRVSRSHLNFIPPEDEAELCTIEKRLRRAVDLRSLTDGFMPMSVYEEMKQEFQKIRNDYFQKMDEICLKWDSLVSDFVKGVDAMLNDIQMPQTTRDTLKSHFMSRIPSKESYMSSFTMSLYVRAFPAEASAVPVGIASSIAADIRDTWTDEVVQTAMLSIEKTVGQGWSKLLAAIRQYLKNATIRDSSISALEKFAYELSWKNVFKSPILTQMEMELKGLSSMDPEDQADVIEGSIGYVYAYAKDINLRLDMKNCPYDQSQLDSMGFVAASQAQKKGA